MTPAHKPAVFDYLDYRQFLQDWYRYEHAAGRVSLRSFSRAAGFTSPNFLKLVMDGDRNLTNASLAKFVVGLKFNKQESEFFARLVAFNQASTHQERDANYQELLKCRKITDHKPIARDQYQYYSSWYHPVVRELLVAADFDGDLEKLAHRIQPELTLAQIEKSVELLVSLGFIMQNEDGTWRQNTPVVTTGPESDSHVLTKYHQSVFDLAKSIIENVAPENRDVSALTLGISTARLPEIKKRLQEFRREILDLVSLDTNPSEVVLLTMQLMPVTSKEGA